MKSNRQVKSVVPKLSQLLTLLLTLSLALIVITSSLSAQNNKKSAPAAAPRAAAPSRPASAPHSAAPAQRPGGGGNSAQRPSGGGAANNRGSAGQTNRPGAGGANANRPGAGGANANNRGTAGQGNRPGAGGTSANRPGANANRPGAGGANANRPGANANRPGAGGANANRPGANANRPGAGGANNRPGGANANNRGGGAANHHQPAGSKTVALKSGGKATFRKDGKVRSVQTARGMKIEHGVHGGRRIESTRNGRKVVSMGKRGGYSQRAYYSHGGRTYVQRTYYVGGRSYAYGYSSYYYGGYPYYGYAPSYYYGPAYYGWAYNPWPAPVTYGWGWGGSPWYGYYGPYFQPYPVYPTAAFWLTDYLIAANLQAAYAAQEGAESGKSGPAPFATQTGNEVASLWTTDPLIAANLGTAYGPYMFGAAAPAAKGGATGLSTEIKQAIADEVKQEIAAEQAAAKGGDQKPAGGEQVPAALDPKIRYFVVSSNLSATTSDGDECDLNPGDVIYRTGDTPDDDHMVDATVKSSKKDDCAVGVTVGVETGDLQEMHNQLRIQMDAGLKELADKQGKNGLPAAPDTKTQAGEVPPPSPDTNVANDLQDQKKEADQAEAEAQQPN